MKCAQLVLTVVLLGATLGCGDKPNPADAGKAVMKGKLVENGKPYVLDTGTLKLPKGATAAPPGTSAESLLAITFTPADGGELAPAKANPATGTFEVVGLDGKGIKPGRYRVTVTGGYGAGAPDAFNERFAPGKSKLVVEVKAGEEIVIDLGKPGG